jgi:2,3-bisphosphoglycerate-independent phosphoglycerate mutase
MPRPGLPIVLVLLDGLGDRPIRELGDLTPAEAADTPNLDALAARGANGIHLPFGWGRAASSEVAHWALFGYQDVPFCGRAVLEALGAGHQVPRAVPIFYAALRPASPDLHLGPFAGPDDAEDARALFASLQAGPDSTQLRFEHVRRAEAILYATGLRSAEITDTEPLRVGEQWIRPRPLAAATIPAEAQQSAAAVERLISRAYGQLRKHPVNRRRAANGQGTLIALTTKWGGELTDVPSFEEKVGLRGGAVTSSALYRGFARLFDVPARHGVDSADLTEDIDRRLALGQALLDEGAEFVHVHTKVTDEAGHTKDPYAKRDVLTQLDKGLERLHALSQQAIVCITGDHATPSTGALMHSGDPTPLMIAGPTVRPDRVQRFGEQHAADGALGIFQAADVLPLLIGHADRARLLGHHPTPHDTLAQPPDGEVPGVENAG